MKYLFPLQFGTGALIAFSFFVTSCGNNKTDIPLGTVSVIDSGTRPVEDAPVICTDWVWNNDKTEITTTCPIKNGELHLGFDEDLIIERPQDPNPQINSPFATAEQHESAYNLLLLNGKPFTGRIKGFNNQSKKQVLDAWVSDGFRYGLFSVWSNLGRVHEKDFSSEASSNAILNQKVRKPIIYFYPTKTTDINVKLHFEGELATTYPKYNSDKGWQVKAQPDGTLHDEQGKEYYALYWEGESGYQYDLSSGFVVRSSEAATFLEEKLEILGLNRREANEFINYWLPILEQSPYNLIHFSGSEYTDQAVLDISPKPETLIRVMMVYQPLKSHQHIKAQQLQKVNRKGFTVVEWGGMEQTDLPQLVK